MGGRSWLRDLTAQREARAASIVALTVVMRLLINLVDLWEEVRASGKDEEFAEVAVGSSRRG